MKQLILGAICGDIIGSVYERFNVLKMDFPLFSRAFTRFTDDTVLTVATMDCQLGKSKNYNFIYCIIINNVTLICWYYFFYKVNILSFFIKNYFVK